MDVKVDIDPTKDNPIILSIGEDAYAMSIETAIDIQAKLTLAVENVLHYINK